MCLCYKIGLNKKTREKERKKMADDIKKVDDIKVAEPKQKIQVDLEVDTSVKDLGVNPYAKLIHMARAVDAWRIFPRLFNSLHNLII